MYGSLKLKIKKRLTYYVHWSFLVIIVWAFSAGIAAGWEMDNLLQPIYFLIAGLIGLVLHELGHLLVAHRFKMLAEEVLIMPTGGIPKVEILPATPLQDFIMLVAGPLMNIIAAVVIGFIIHPEAYIWSLVQFDWALPSGNFLFSLYSVNIFLAVFNLIPAFPLDGGRIIRTLLTAVKVNYIRANYMVHKLGFIVAAIFIIAGLLYFNPFMLLLGVYIIAYSSKEKFYIRVKDLFFGIKVGEVVMYNYASLDANVTVNQAVNILMNNYSDKFLVMEGAMPVGYVLRCEIIKAAAEMKYNTPIRDLINDKMVFLDAETNVSSVLNKMSFHEKKVYPVLDQGKFAGVVSFQRVIEYLLLNKAITSDYPKVKSVASLLFQ